MWKKAAQVVDERLRANYQDALLGAHLGALVFPRMAAVRWTIRDFWVVAVCGHRGHLLQEEADAENGSSELECQRCGWSRTAWF